MALPKGDARAANKRRRENRRKLSPKPTEVTNRNKELAKRGIFTKKTLRHQGKRGFR